MLLIVVINSVDLYISLFCFYCDLLVVFGLLGCLLWLLMIVGCADFVFWCFSPLLGFVVYCFGRAVLVDYWLTVFRSLFVFDCGVYGLLSGI